MRKISSAVQLNMLKSVLNGDNKLNQSKNKTSDGGEFEKLISKLLSGDAESEKNETVNLTGELLLNSEESSELFEKLKSKGLNIDPSLFLVSNQEKNVQTEKSTSGKFSEIKILDLESSKRVLLEQKPSEVENSNSNNKNAETKFLISQQSLKLQQSSANQNNKLKQLKDKNINLAENEVFSENKNGTPEAKETKKTGLEKLFSQDNQNQNNKSNVLLKNSEKLNNKNNKTNIYIPKSESTKNKETVDEKNPGLKLSTFKAESGKIDFKELSSESKNNNNNGNKNSESHIESNNVKHSVKTNETVKTKDFSTYEKTDIKLTEQIKKSFKGQYSPEKKEVQIQLKPKELGKVNIKLNYDGGKLKGEIHVENQFVRSKLESSLDSLKSDLIRQGINIEQFQLETNKTAPKQLEQNFMNNSFGHQNSGFQDQSGENQNYNQRQFEFQFQQFLNIDQEGSAKTIEKNLKENYSALNLLA